MATGCGSAIGDAVSGCGSMIGGVVNWVIGAQSLASRLPPSGKLGDHGPRGDHDDHGHGHPDVLGGPGESLLHLLRHPVQAR
ncbi:hypothetical protein EBZ80_20315 [bacterium]|nr:hypothetical protein [bacterium]